MPTVYPGYGSFKLITVFCDEKQQDKAGVWSCKGDAGFKIKFKNKDSSIMTKPGRNVVSFLSPVFQVIFSCPCCTSVSAHLTKLADLVIT